MLTKKNKFVYILEDNVIQKFIVVHRFDIKLREGINTKKLNMCLLVKEKPQNSIYSATKVIPWQKVFFLRENLLKSL